MSFAAAAQVQPGESLDSRRLSSTAGAFAGSLADSDLFGGAVADIGDLDLDGVDDIVVGAMWDNDGGPNRGAVWVLFLKPNGTVKSHQKISDLAGGFTGVLDDDDQFGVSVALVGDLNSDGVQDIIVGANKDDDGGTDRGAVWILFLKNDGTVFFNSKISHTQGGFAGPLDDGDFFGLSVTGLGDLNSDGREDVAVGAILDDDAGSNRGAVWVLFLQPFGGVASATKISQGAGGFTSSLANGDWFGSALASADLNDDGLSDLAVGARNDDDGGPDRGAVWLLLLNASGTVAEEQKLSATQGGITPALADGDRFGNAVAFLPDVNLDGELDLVVGAPLCDDGGTDSGSIWILTLTSTQTILNSQKISATTGGLAPTIAAGDQFGYAVAALGTNQLFGYGSVLTGSRFADDGGTDRGAAHLLQISTGVFTALGNSLAGGLGFPTSTGSGGTSPGGGIGFLLDNAVTQAPAFFVVGITHLGVPLFGGVLVPDPLLVLPGFNTGFVGKVLVTGAVPVGVPAGFPIYTQFWVADPAGPLGYSASNGLAFVTP
ncbi:MAG: hypothetical protein ACT4PU_00895 [Planctomycetota bacterium]